MDPEQGIGSQRRPEPGRQQKPRSRFVLGEEPARDLQRRQPRQPSKTLRELQPRLQE